MAGPVAATSARNASFDRNRQLAATGRLPAWPCRTWAVTLARVHNHRRREGTVEIPATSRGKGREISCHTRATSGGDPRFPGCYSGYRRSDRNAL
jgi:hypothetical protein